LRDGFATLVADSVHSVQQLMSSFNVREI
jgi:hypothetical protein